MLQPGSQWYRWVKRTCGRMWSKGIIFGGNLVVEFITIMDDFPYIGNLREVHGKG